MSAILAEHNDDRDGDAGVLLRLLEARHSCRGFRPEPLPRATIEAMLEIAQRSASWCNLQPWQVIVTEGEGTERLRRALYDHVTARMADGVAAVSDFPFPIYEGVYRERRRATGSLLYEATGVRRGDLAGATRQSLENFRFFGAPHAVIITTEDALGTYGAIDCGGYVATLLLAAQSLGVASIAQASFASCSPFLRDYFGLPENRRVVCGLSIGIEDIEHPANRFRTPRASLAEAIDWAVD